MATADEDLASRVDKCRSLLETVSKQLGYQARQLRRQKAPQTTVDDLTKSMRTVDKARLLLTRDAEAFDDARSSAACSLLSINTQEEEPQFETPVNSKGTVTPVGKSSGLGNEQAKAQQATPSDVSFAQPCEPRESTVISVGKSSGPGCEHDNAQQAMPSEYSFVQPRKPRKFFRAKRTFRTAEPLSTEETDLHTVSNEDIEYLIGSDRPVTKMYVFMRCSPAP
eukprot:TRINITY_DN11498_c0_g1_i4.p1 TRINITY_DN11498_c0_g1~~TRINITY_DN11498_c0_g1_i4.p1  ORF type:complete len:224 (-),score=29.75 TRINITY_DN11498_c0_g1_i4:845-1516(-)